IAAYHTSTTVAVQDALQRHASTTLPYADSSVKRKPHPPSQTCGQSRRPISSQRLARTTQIEDRPNSKFNSISAMTRVYGPHNKRNNKISRMPAYLSLNLMMHQHMCMASPLAQDDSREIFHIDT
ncbi:hypothetical protein BSL78_01530, partial [Apostichopus japonicus]